MNRLKIAIAALAITLPLFSCASYNAYEKAKTAEKLKNWDDAVIEYQKALEVDPDNLRYRVYLQRAKREASRVHFEKGKTLRTAAMQSVGTDQLRLAQLAAAELELTVKLDPSNQFAAVERDKAVGTIQDLTVRNDQTLSIDDIKKRAKNNVSKAQPPQLNPASDQPISLSFPRETPIKEIYKALGNAFGINILFDQAIKESERLSIELKDVTAQVALERVMQAVNHFYKVLDSHSIIVVPDNPQARRDYEDLVIRTFYLSNGDAEQVTNVVRTMIEARNVFPLKALNAITIRDTADKVRIAEKIIEANDKAKAEVVVDVELVQLDLNRGRDMGFALSASASNGSISPQGSVTDTAGKTTGGTISSITLNQLKTLGHSGNYSITLPTASYALLKSISNVSLLANPELRISEGEKATLHIGNRIPVPVTTFTTGVQQNNFGSLPATSYQYQDIGIKVAIEPRVHHNREVTLKLTVEVSSQGPDAPAPAGQIAQPTFITRTIESTIRLKDGETNFLAGLIREDLTNSDQKTPFLGDLPFIGRLFTQNHQSSIKTDLILTMTPHIIRIPDITEDDLAPMWVGTTNNLTFRGMSPRLESRSASDPFVNRSAASGQFGTDAATGLPLADGEPGNVIRPSTGPIAPGTAPNDAFRNQPPPPPPVRPPSNSSLVTPSPAGNGADSGISVAAVSGASSDSEGLSPRISPQPVHLSIHSGEEKLWTVVGMDLDGLSTNRIVLHYDPRTLDVSEVLFGPALAIDIKVPPVVTIDRTSGTIKISSSNSQPLQFQAGGDIAMLRVHGGIGGETFLVVENPDLKNRHGDTVAATVSGGRAKVE